MKAFSKRMLALGLAFAMVCTSNGMTIFAEEALVESDAAIQTVATVEEVAADTADAADKTDAADKADTADTADTAGTDEIVVSNSANLKSSTIQKVVEEDWTLSEDTVISGSLSLTDGTLDLNGYELTVNGDVYHTGGTLKLNNGTLNISGDYSAQIVSYNSANEASYEQSGAYLEMTDSHDTMNVSGDFFWYGNYTYLYEGTLTVTGDFIIRGGNFWTGDNNVIVLNGTGTQTVSDIENCVWFNQLKIENSDSHEINWSGHLDVGLLLSDAGEVTIVPDDLVIDALDMNRNTVTFTESVTEDGDIDVDGGVLNIEGTLTHTYGTLKLNNGTVNLQGDYVAQTESKNSAGESVYYSVSAWLEMTAAYDAMNVAGDFIWYGSSVNLTSGTLTITGDFINRGCGFSNSDDHVVVLNGTGVQTVSDTENCTYFSQLKIENSDSREINWSGHLDIGLLLSDAGEVTIVPDSLVVDALDMNRNTVTFTESVTEDGDIDVDGGVLNIEGTLTHTYGTLKLNNGTVNLQGDYVAQTESQNSAGESVYYSVSAWLEMTNTYDAMNVAGDFIWYGNSVNMNSGTLTITGDFINRGSSFENWDNHVVVLNGTGAQKVSDTENRTYFSQLKIENSDSREISWSGYMEIALLLSDTSEVTIVPDNLVIETLDMNRKTVTFTGSVTEDGDLDVDGGVLNIEGTLTHIGGTLRVNNGTVNLQGDYLAQTESQNSAGESVYYSVGAWLEMTNTYDAVNVAGDFVWYGGSTNTLSSGTLTVTGDFINRGSNFESIDNNVIVLNGTGTQTVSDASGCMTFGQLQIENADIRTIQWVGNLRINTLLTNLTIDPDSLVISGLNVNKHTVTINGDVTETGDIDVNAGVLSISGNLLHTDGTLYPNNGTVSIGGNYAAQIESENNVGQAIYESVSACISMTNSYDVISVAGDFSWYGNWVDFSEGVLSIGGNFTDRDSNYPIYAYNNHKTILNGESDQTVIFASTDGQFNTLQLTRDTDTYTFSHEPCWNTLIEVEKECEHQYGNYISNNNATCTEDGTKTATCLICGETDTVVDEGSATGHSWGTQTFTWESDYSAATAVLTCTTCGETTGVLNAVITSEVTAATCTAEGIIVYTATVTYDGQTYIDTKSESIPATGHSYTSEVTTAATCTTAGVRTYTCSSCGDTYTESIAATGHGATEVRNASEATCTTDGYTGDTYCTVCGEKIASGNTIPATGHSYTSEVTTAATCTTDGVRTYTCTICGDVQTEAIAATGHGETEVRNAVEATCTTDGYTGDTYCTVCGEKTASGTTIAATGHSYTSKVTTAATCTMDGVRTYTCSTCGDTYTEVIAATGHGATEVRNATEATCTTDGYTGDTYCTVCGEKLSSGSTIPATGHSYTSEITKAATCTTDGVRTYTCSNCGDTYTETIAATGHGETEIRNAVEATSTTDGYTGDTYCTVCGEKIASGTTIPATGPVVIADMSECTITLSSTSYTYTGSAKKPTVTVKYGSTTLVSGTDYTVSYSNNTNAGTATVTITGQGDYTGTVTKNFTINKASQTVSVKTKGSTSIRAGGDTTWKAKTTGDGTITYSTTASSSVGTVNSSTGKVTAVGVGTINVYATAAATANYKASSKTLIATITVGLSAPTISSVTQSGTGVTIKWSKITGAKGYYVYRSGSKNGVYTKVKTITSGSTLSCKDTSTMTSGKTYYYVVYAYSGSKRSSASTAKSITYMKGTISSLTNTSSGITVKWSKVTGASGYYIYRKASTASSYTLVKKITSSSKVSYTDTGVKSKNGTTYTYYVQPYKGSSKGAYTTMKTVRLKAVSISSLKNSSSKKMKVKWAKNSKATGYEIEYSTSSKFTSSTTKTVTVSKAATTSRTIGSLTKGKKYYVRIRTYKKVSKTKYYSAWSSTKSVKISK